jgi:plastocyanin
VRLKTLLLASASAGFLLTACAGTDAAVGVEVNAREMRFSPSTLRLAAGERTLTVHNRGKLTHTFSLNALGEEVTVPPGKSKTLTLNLVPGSYAYVCRILDHEGLGMHGTLRVRAT